jgi:hypothetical protein
MPSSRGVLDLASLTLMIVATLTACYDTRVVDAARVAGKRAALPSDRGFFARLDISSRGLYSHGFS